MRASSQRVAPSPRRRRVPRERHFFRTTTTAPRGRGGVTTATGQPTQTRVVWRARLAARCAFLPSPRYGIKAEKTGNELTESFPFNLMFKTMIGPTGPCVAAIDRSRPPPSWPTQTAARRDARGSARRAAAPDPTTHTDTLRDDTLSHTHRAAPRPAPCPLCVDHARQARSSATCGPRRRRASSSTSGACASAPMSPRPSRILRFPLPKSFVPPSRILRFPSRRIRRSPLPNPSCLPPEALSARDTRAVGSIPAVSRIATTTAATDPARAGKTRRAAAACWRARLGGSVLLSRWVAGVDIAVCVMTARRCVLCGSARRCVCVLMQLLFNGQAAARLQRGQDAVRGRADRPRLPQRGGGT